MLKRKAELKHKARKSFKREWLSHLVNTDVPFQPEKQKTKIGNIFNYREDIGEVVCTICAKAKIGGEFANGKKWEEWKLDYLKRHLNQKIHLDAVTTLNNQNKFGIERILSETVEDRKTKQEFNQRLKSNPEMIKVLIDNVLLAIKMDASMNSVQEIHDHVAKYVQIPESWRSKNYAFEFVECISFVLKNEIMDTLRKATFHTLIVDESTDISVQKMLILYFKFRSENETFYKTVFGGILKLRSCDSVTIAEEIKKFYVKNNIDMQKMVMFTSDGASVMLGKKNGAAAILRRDIKHLTEQHCVAHREDLGIDDACRKVSIMQDIEKLLRTVYTMFSRSPVKKQKLEELAHISEHDVVSFKPLNEVRWLSRQFAVNALMRNYDVLIEYCEDQVNNFNDPICNYCITILTNPQYRVALTVFNDVLDDLASLCKFLQKSCLTTIEAFDYVKAKINKLKSQYLGNTIYWSEKVKKVFEKVGYDVDTASIIRFVERVCNHLNNRFPDDELKEWQAFNLNAILNASSFEFGNENVKRLIRKYSIILNIDNNESAASKILEQYCNFKFIISQKLKNCSIQTFNDMLNYVLNDNEFKELAVIIDIVGTFQASSVDCERGFSVMNSIKCKIRNRLESEHLCNLMRIRMHLSSGEEVNLQSVYKYWISKKDRRENINQN